MGEGQSEENYGGIPVMFVTRFKHASFSLVICCQCNLVITNEDKVMYCVSPGSLPSLIQSVADRLWAWLNCTLSLTNSLDLLLRSTVTFSILSLLHPHKSLTSTSPVSLPWDSAQSTTSWNVVVAVTITLLQVNILLWTNPWQTNSVLHKASLSLHLL